MKPIAHTIITAVLWIAPFVLAQELTSAGPDLKPTSETSLDPTAIAVLPVEVRSANPAYVQLAEVVYTEFLKQLKTIDGVHVIDPVLIRPYSTSALEPEEIARQLGAAKMLQSSVAAAPPAYQVRYAFIDVQSGQHHMTSVMRSSEEWRPHQSLDARVRETIAEQTKSVEQIIFPNRRNAADHEAISAEARARFLDASLSSKDRLAALRTTTPPFRAGFPRQYVDGGASLTGEIAIAAAQLATDSNDPAVRRTLWYTMVGVDDPNLVDPLIHALANDVDATVRTAAAQALAVHLSAQGVRAALETAREHDPDRRVRSAAHMASATEEEQRSTLRRRVMDVSLPESERRTALLNLWSMSRSDPVPADAELASALIDFAKTSTDRRTRRTVWFSLGEMGGTAIATALIEALSSEPDENLRETLVGALSGNIDEPGVRDALEEAKAGDRSPLVRAAAECALQGGGWC